MPATTGERLIGNKLEDIAPNHRARYDWAISILKRTVPDGATILDAASGVGYGSMMMAQAGYKVVAIDRAEEARKYQKFVFAHPRVKFFHDDIFRALGEFDAAVSIETIEHIQNSRAWINHLGRLTDIIIGTVPNQDVVPFDPKKHEFHFRHFTKSEIGVLMTGWALSEWATQYAKWENFEMRPGDDGMTLGFLAEKILTGPEA